MVFLPLRLLASFSDEMLTACNFKCGFALVFSVLDFVALTLSGCFVFCLCVLDLI